MRGDFFCCDGFVVCVGQPSWLIPRNVLLFTEATVVEKLTGLLCSWEEQVLAERVDVLMIGKGNTSNHPFFYIIDKCFHHLCIQCLLRELCPRGHMCSFCFLVPNKCILIMMMITSIGGKNMRFPIRHWTMYVYLYFKTF